MKSISLVSSVLVAVATLAGYASANSVFAHVIVGNVCSYTSATWASDIALAQAAGIDAFALNIAPPLAGCISDQISLAFTAAGSASFKLFFSFDYLGGGSPWAAADVISVLQTYAPDDAHFRFKSLPLVSTFEGTSNIADWTSIRAAVSGGIYFVPDWTSLGPSGVQSNINAIDGAFSWDMWPDGPVDSSDTNDQAWVTALGSKTFMMGISPWFFTNLPSYHKAWVWRGDDMWHERWQQILELQPPLVEIVTWNDFGESHYIGPIYDAGIPNSAGADATTYVDGMDHDHWRDLLPYYIAQYKGTEYTISEEMIQYWYRETPAAGGSADGVTGNDCVSAINIGGYQTCYDPNSIVQDKVFVSALVATLPATINVQIGTNPVVSTDATVVGVTHFSVPFEGMTGAVTVTLVRNGVAGITSTGPEIISSPSSGNTNYNAWVGGTHAV